MTNEQLTKEFIKLAEHQAKYDAEKENMMNLIEELKEDVKSTKNLTEDVHIMAKTMETMQKTLAETNEKVDKLSSEEYNNYKENKKIIKDKALGAIGGAIGTGIVAIIIWFSNLMKGGN